MTKRVETTPWARNEARRAHRSLARSLSRETPFSVQDLAHYLDLGAEAGLTIAETLTMVWNAAERNRRPDEELAKLATAEFPGTETLMVNAALHLALWLHRDQVDKQGEPYSGHLARVADRVRELGGTPEQVAIGWLHDSVEDGLIRLATIGDVFGERVRLAVLDLTRDKVTESYGDYIGRLCRDDGRSSRVDSLLVKRADLEDNMDRSRGPAPARLTERYELALPRILEALGCVMAVDPGREMEATP